MQSTCDGLQIGINHQMTNLYFNFGSNMVICHYMKSTVKPLCYLSLHKFIYFSMKLPCVQTWINEWNEVTWKIYMLEVKRIGLFIHMVVVVDLNQRWMFLQHSVYPFWSDQIGSISNIINSQRLLCSPVQYINKVIYTCAPNRRERTKKNNIENRLLINDWIICTQSLSVVKILIYWCCEGKWHSKILTN